MGLWSWLFGERGYRAPTTPTPLPETFVKEREALERTKAKMPKPTPPRRVSGSEIRKANTPKTSTVRRRESDSDYTPPLSSPSYYDSTPSYSSFDFGSSSSYDSGSSSSSSSFDGGGGSFGGGGSSGDW